MPGFRRLKSAVGFCDRFTKRLSRSTALRGWHGRGGQDHLKLLEIETAVMQQIGD
jgi:hypothetical protein